ncbi:MAG: ATPase, T2SS/T4P/T4SS family, partial [Chloroflexota bacterium]
MALSSGNRTGISSRRNIRSTQGVGSGSVQVLPNQIEDARRFLSENLTPEDLNPTNLARGGRDKVITLLRQAVNDGHIKGAPRNAPDRFLRAIYNNTIGLGVLEEFLGNKDVEQINVVGPKKIILQMKGIWTEVTDDDLLFRDVEELKMVSSNIARRVGKELSKHTNPIVDIRFENPVLRIHINMTRRGHGISLYIRRGREEPFSTDFLLEAGNFNREVMGVLQDAARRLIGTVFIGGVGSGKTVMLEKFIDWMPNVPIVVVDDAGDCQPSHSMCAVFDLPETSYTANKQVNLSLGGLTRAALREGDVLIVAETRGA